MKLSIRNVGKLKEADIEINGITVIAGENNTGKSTVSKALFSLFNGFYNFDNKMLELKSGDIRNIFLRFIKNLNRENSNILIDIPDKIVKDTSYKFDRNKLIKLIQENRNFISIEYLGEVSEKIFDILNIKDEEYLENTISYILNNEFDNQINTIWSDDLGEIALKIKENELKLKIKNNKVIKIENKINLRSEVIYIDDPFVIDNLNEYKWRDINYLENHKESLETKLIREKNEKTFSEKIIAKNNLQQITEKLKEVINGKIKFNQGKWIYELENNKELNLKNLSAGLKSFAILKRLIENGNLEEKGIVILDEPEIHLHPEWQIKFAELIVLLQKEFKMHILLTTHSPYFLKAVQVYSKKYKISNKCKYYMSELDGEQAILVDKTNKTDDLFYKLAISFENLMNEEELYED
ncbi:ATP-binding protein [uncultured Leptotrichia sp.]|uniref:ATP-binding protein n=1 Tax=uncultured Leptotrichia sp. TaxID=159271 RepID=UPI00261F0C74|nr:ATP-binding protein [uncultured Leptotrichia sp.]